MRDSKVVRDRPFAINLLLRIISVVSPGDRLSIHNLCEQRSGERAYSDISTTSPQAWPYWSIWLLRRAQSRGVHRYFFLDSGD